MERIYTVSALNGDADTSFVIHIVATKPEEALEKVQKMLAYPIEFRYGIKIKIEKEA